MTGSGPAGEYTMVDVRSALARVAELLTGATDRHNDIANTLAEARASQGEQNDPGTPE